MIRVHLHTEEPAEVIRFARSLGQVDRLSVRDMDEQHQTFLQGWEATTPEVTEENSVVLLALVPSEGLGTLFRSLGAESVVVDEQNTVQGIEELRKTLEARLDCRVLILPNSTYLLSAADDLFDSFAKQVRIIPTKTIPQGISAILAHSPAEDSETNYRHMVEAIEKVHSIEICDAAHFRDAEVDSFVGARCVGLLEGELAAGGEDAWTVLKKVLGRLEVDSAELITIYYSNEHAKVAEEMDFNLHRKYPHLEVETVPAGRLRSDFIISLE
jgi:dihydroxyacetone kinase-like predicted kinase